MSGNIDINAFKRYENVRRVAPFDIETMPTKQFEKYLNRIMIERTQIARLILGCRDEIEKDGLNAIYDYLSDHLRLLLAL